MLSWSPGHDGFSPITKCHIRVSLVPVHRCPPPAGQRIGHYRFSDWSKVKEVSRREGEVRMTRVINVTAPPFHYEVPGLQAVTRYNISVSCSNEVGASPVTTWIQGDTTEGGVCDCCWLHSQDVWIQNLNWQLWLSIRLEGFSSFR